MHSRHFAYLGALVAGAAFILGAGVCGAQIADQDLAKIETVVVIYAENRSFDHLYGFFPGANGIAQATDEQKTQLDHDGTPLPYLTVFDHGKPAEGYPQLPNAPFAIEGPPLNKSADKVLPARSTPSITTRSRSTAARTICSPRCPTAAAG